MNSKLISRMPMLQGYQQSFYQLQGVWDSLSLLGHLSGTGTDMTATRQAFQALTADLLDNIGAETLKKTTLEIKAKSQVAVDVLVRNLFERTADIGFLCSDEEVRLFLVDYPELDREAANYSDKAKATREALSARRAAIRKRFQEYADKYSVYSNIVLLDPDGKILIQMQDSPHVERTSDPIVDMALKTTAPYAERFSQSDLVPDERQSLIYAYRVESCGKRLGVLCLVFRFENEMHGIFRNLIAPGEWDVLTIIDASNTVIASSDPYHIPVGAVVEPAMVENGMITRFAGREYLAVTRKTKGYQGYLGPGWRGHAMIPVEYAFDKDASALLRAVPEAVLADVRGNPSIFPQALRNIPRQAEQIQRELNRSVWNGNLMLGREKSDNNGFSKVLLWEISNTGRKTTEIFEKSIANLHETVVSSIMHDSMFMASLAVDIMDRNLYERANDCRWWALDSRLADVLAGTDGDADSASEILHRINSLYTVYSNLILFDSNGNVVAVSNPGEQELVGTTLNEAWVRSTLSLGDSSQFCASGFNKTGLYGGRHTYVFGAALRDSSGRIVGGIGIVFDSEPQFHAMLTDSLPKNEHGETVHGAFGVFCDSEQNVISATGRFVVGDRLALDQTFLSSDSGFSGIVAIDGEHFAVGARSSRGYREYAGVGATALVFIPLGKAGHADARPATRRPHQQRAKTSEETLDVATFTIGDQWFGIRAEHVVEAIDASGIFTMPGTPDCCAGHVMWHDKPVIVLNGGRLVHPPIKCNGNNVIILDDGVHGEFGVLVDNLDAIPEIEKSEIRSVGASAGELVEAVAKPSGGEILAILGVGSLAREYLAQSPAQRGTLPRTRQLNAA